MNQRDFGPIHPGEILLEKFLKPMGITQYRLAKGINVPQRRISEIVQGKRSITADTALRLGRFFGMEAQFWLSLQARYDLAGRTRFGFQPQRRSPPVCGSPTGGLSAAEDAAIVD
jgi:addiction module HigA family antidote